MAIRGEKLSVRGSLTDGNKWTSDAKSAKQKADDDSSRGEAPEVRI